MFKLTKIVFCYFVRDILNIHFGDQETLVCSCLSLARIGDLLSQEAATLGSKTPHLPMPGLCVLPTVDTWHVTCPLDAVCMFAL